MLKWDFRGKTKKLLSLLAAAAMAVTSLTGAISVSAAEKGDVVLTKTLSPISGQTNGAKLTVYSSGLCEIEGTGENGAGSVNTLDVLSYNKANTPEIKDIDIIEIDIKEGITHIGTAALYSVTTLTKLTIPSTVVSIGNSTFDGLSNPELVVDCKMKCDNTEGLKIPANNSFLRGFAGKFKVHTQEAVDYFGKVSALLGKIVLVNDDGSEQDIVQTIKSGTFNAYTGQQSGANYVLDSKGVFTVTGAGEDGSGSIGTFSSTFSATYKDQIKEIVIKEGITHIGEFANLGNCTKISIPESVTLIGNDSFRGCNNPDLVIDIKGTPTIQSAFSQVFGTIKVYNQTAYENVAKVAKSAKIELVGDERQDATLTISLDESKLNDGKYEFNYGDDSAVKVEGNEGEGTVTFGLYNETDKNCVTNQLKNEFVTTGNIKYIDRLGTFFIRASVPQTATHKAAVSNILTVTISLTVDKTELQAVYDEYVKKTDSSVSANRAHSNKYKEESYKSFGDALVKANGYIRSYTVTQEEIDAVIAEIKETYKDLKFDYATEEEIQALKDVIARAEELAKTKYDYIKDIWDATGFDKAIADAKSALTDFTMDGQEQPLHSDVEYRTSNLNKCFDKPLQLEPAAAKEYAWSQLDPLIAEAKEVELEKDDYTAETYKPLGDLLVEVEGKTLHDMFRETIESYTEQFKTAIAGLVIDQVLPTPGDPFLPVYTGGGEAYIYQDGVADDSLESVTTIRFTVNNDYAFGNDTLDITAVINGVRSAGKLNFNRGIGLQGTLELTNPIKGGQSMTLFASTLGGGIEIDPNTPVYNITMIEFLDKRGRVLKYITDATVAKDALTAAIAEANAVEAGNYTDDSYASLKKALDAAEALGDNATAAEFKAAKEAIDAAIEALAYKPADYTKVDEAIAKVPSDLSKYTEETAKAVTDAVAAVVRDKNITEQDVVDGYAKAIEDAIAGLQAKQTSSKTTSKTTNTTAKTTKATKATRSADAVKKDKSAAKKAMKQAKITKLTVKSKAKKINATWNKVKKAKGYEVQVSTNKKFKKSKIIFKKLTTKKKLTIKNKKIKSKKTYYVRVRAYATYKDTNNVVQKVYSAWNKKLRKVKVK